MTSLRVLGRPLLEAEGAPLVLGVRKTWALLVLLACAGDVPRARVAALLWPELDESTARRNLRRELARIAEAHAGRLVRADGDYLALDAAVDVDRRRFEAAAAAGRRDEALALWRGPLADGLDVADAPAFGDWLVLERERLHALWRRLLDEAAEAAAPQQPALAIEHLNTLLADDPLQERHHRALIRLQLALGRREAALAQFERCRRLLADELGLAPMAETAALVAAVRNEAAAPPPALRLTGELPFVGREAEVQALEAAWQHGGCWLIEGEGGVGKTRLATGFCAAHGAYALARCQPGDRAVPYAAFTRVLRVLAGAEPDGLAPWVQAELARLLPELGAAPRPLASAEERSRFFEACARAWQQLADDSFDAIVVDDWQHADDPSQALLAFVSERSAAVRLLLLARPGSIAAALTEGAALRLKLAPLGAGPVVELVRQVSGAAAPQRFAHRLQTATGGNPFFIAETLRHLAESGTLQADAHGRWSTPFDDATQDYRELPLPTSVRDAVLARVQRLPDAPRRLLEAASVAAEPFAPALLAAACALSELEAVGAIELALDATLLREHERGGYGFSHDLARQALESALAPERRRLVHRRLALAAEETRADPALTALHFEAAGQPQRALPFRVAAGDEAQRLFAAEQALRHWQAGLADAPSTAQRLQLLRRCARAQIDLGDRSGPLQRIAEIDALLVDGGLSEEQRITTQLACAELQVELHDAAAALPRLDALLADAEAVAADQRPRGWRTKVLRTRSQALQQLGRLDDAQADVDSALARHDVEPLERATLLDALQLIEYQRGRVRRALAHVREALPLWRTHGDRRAIAKSHYRLGLMLLVNGEPDAAEQELELALSMAAEMRLVEQQRDAIINLLKVHADRGDAQRMLALAERGWALSPTFARPRIRQILLQAQCHAHGLLGNLGRCIVLAEQFLAVAEAEVEPASLQYAVLTVLDLLAYLGDFERGRALLQRVAASGTREMGYLGIKLALSRVFLEHCAGDAAAARAALADAGDPALLEQVQDRATYALRLAEVQLVDGDAAAAFATLQPWRGELPNVELVALTWVARLHAALALGAVDAADWQQAHAALGAGPLPALEAMELRRALQTSAPTPVLAATLAAEADADWQRLVRSLDEQPEHQRRFIAAYAHRHRLQHSLPRSLQH